MPTHHIAPAPPPPAPARMYRLILRDEGDPESRYRRLRAALKVLLRVFGFRNMRLEPIDEEGEQ